MCMVHGGTCDASCETEQALAGPPDCREEPASGDWVTKDRKGNSCFLEWWRAISRQGVLYQKRPLKIAALARDRTNIRSSDTRLPKQAMSDSSLSGKGDRRTQVECVPNHPFRRG